MIQIVEFQVSFWSFNIYLFEEIWLW